MDRAAHRLKKHEAIVATALGQCNDLACRTPRCYAWRVKRWGAAGGLWLAISVLAAAHSSFVPTDPPMALIQGDPGRTTLSFAAEETGWAFTLSRSVTSWCEVTAVVSVRSPFDLHLRALAVPNAFPAEIVLDVARDRVDVFGALHLGPARLTADRVWGEGARTRVALHLAAGPRLIMAAGVDLVNQEVQPFVSFTVLPKATPLWSLSFVCGGGGPRLAVGGTW